MMAGDDELLPVDDKALFEAAIGSEPPAEPDKPKAAPEPRDEKPRDEAGRFVSRAQETERPAPEPAGEKSPSEEPLSSADAIPSWRLREETERRRMAEERFAATQAQLQNLLYERQQQVRQQSQEPELPDPIEDPVGFRQAILWQRQQDRQALFAEFRKQQIQYSLHRADQSYGDQFREAYKAFDSPQQSGNALLLERVRNAFDPAEEIMSWHREQKTLSEVGGDPKAYREKLKAELRAELAQDPAFQQELLGSMHASARTRPSTVTPLPNLSRAPGSAGMSEETLPVSDADFFADAIRPMQRRR